MKKIALKYCGGCNPRFNRVQLANKLFEAFPELIQVSHDTLNPWLALVVCGCPSCCTEHSHMMGDIGKTVICTPEEFYKLHEKLTCLLREQKGADSV